MKRMTVVAYGAVVVMAVACAKKETPPPPPVEVKVAPVVQKDVPVYVEVIGQTRGSTEIEVRARVEGFLDSVNYKEGSYVQKGQLMYTIDPRPLEASAAQARGVEAQAEANLARARQDVARYAPLVAKNAISRQDYETSVQLEKAAEASLEAARANRTGSDVNLSFTKVIAPAAGLAGKTEVYPGTLVGRGQSTLLTRISQVDNIHVRVNIPERDFMEYQRRGEERRKAGNAVPLKFELVLSDGSVHPYKGDLVFVDRAVEGQTGTILVEVAFPNPGGTVRPGQFGRVRVAIDEKKNAILVPQRAVTELQGGARVAVAGTDGKAEIRAVETGPRFRDLWVIEKGVKPGENVIVSGLQYVRAGTPVAAKPAPASPAALASR